MFDLSLMELVVIAGVALVVLGPEELPRLLYALGRFVGKAKAMWGGFEAEAWQAMEPPAQTPGAATGDNKENNPQ